MKKGLMIAVALSALGLAGCVVVPAYDAPYGGYGPGAYVAPPAVVVRPAFYGRLGYYGGRGHGYYR
jgi:hypothetical protein